MIKVNVLSSIEIRSVA